MQAWDELILWFLKVGIDDRGVFRGSDHCHYALNPNNNYKQASS